MNPISITAFCIWLFGAIVFGFWLFKQQEDDFNVFPEIRELWTSGHKWGAIALIKLLVLLCLLWPAFIIAYAIEEYHQWKERKRSNRKDQDPGSSQETPKH